jgi:PHP family Zn ribbon phosphoesterase
MIPPAIASRAAAAGIDVIGISDHNTAENVSAVREAAAEYGLEILGGMEVTTEEEVHVLGYFDRPEELEDFQGYIYAHLHGSNSPDAFGHQWVVDSEGGVLDINPRLLIGATELSIHRVVKAIHERKGIAIAAHIDRQSFSIFSQLGFIPADLELDAVELSPFHSGSELDIGPVAIPKVTFSDAHYIEEIGRAVTEIKMAGSSVHELKKALTEGDGGSIKPSD